MKRLFVIVATILVILGTGCASMRPVAPETSSFDWPPLNQPVEKELGDTLIDKGIIRSYDAISITDPVVASFGIGKWTASPGSYIASATFGNATLYRNPQPIVIKGLLASSTASGGIAVEP